MARRVLPPPPIVVQGEGYKCWAAALSSWLAVTPGRRKREMEWLLRYSRKFRSPFEKDKEKSQQLPDEAINTAMFVEMVKDVELDLRMEYEELPAGRILADDHLYQRMAWHGGYLIVVYTPTGQGRNMTRHANVIFGASDDGSVTVMEPQLGRVMGKHKDTFGAPLLIAWAGAVRNPFDDAVPLRSTTTPSATPTWRIR